MRHVSRSISLGLVGAALAGVLATLPAVSVAMHHSQVQANGYDTSPGSVQPTSSQSSVSLATTVGLSARS